MEDLIIIGILVIVVAVAILRAAKHFKGGGCCGSGSSAYRSKKKLTGPKTGEKTLIVEGMHCENCEIRVENAVNRIEGAVCKASHKKKTAVVSLSREVSDEQLRQAVEEMGYQVLEVR